MQPFPSLWRWKPWIQLEMNTQTSEKPLIEENNMSKIIYSLLLRRDFPCSVSVVPLFRVGYVRDCSEHTAELM